MGTSTASSIDTCMRKTIFSSSTEAYFNKVITARRLVRVGLKNEPMDRGVVVHEPIAMQHAITLHYSSSSPVGHKA